MAYVLVFRELRRVPSASHVICLFHISKLSHCAVGTIFADVPQPAVGSKDLRRGPDASTYSLEIILGVRRLVHAEDLVDWRLLPLSVTVYSVRSDSPVSIDNRRRLVK